MLFDDSGSDAMSATHETTSIRRCDGIFLSRNPDVLVSPRNIVSAMPETNSVIMLASDDEDAAGSVSNNGDPLAPSESTEDSQIIETSTPAQRSSDTAASTGNETRDAEIFAARMETPGGSPSHNEADGSNATHDGIATSPRAITHSTGTNSDLAVVNSIDHVPLTTQDRSDLAPFGDNDSTSTPQQQAPLVPSDEHSVTVFSPSSNETSLSDDFKSPVESRKRNAAAVDTTVLYCTASGYWQQLVFSRYMSTRSLSNMFSCIRCISMKKTTLDMFLM